MQGWQVGFQELNPDVTVEYDPIGSGGGREQFLSGGSNFAGSDAFLKDDEFEQSKERCAGDRGAINLPHYISPIAIPYNLLAVVDSLNLTPDVIGGIFANTITNWNDPAIADRQPRRRVARPGDQPGAPLRRVRHHRELHRLHGPGRARRRGRSVRSSCGTTTARAAAKAPRAPRGVVAAVGRR